MLTNLQAGTGPRMRGCNRGYSRRSEFTNQLNKSSIIKLRPIMTIMCTLYQPEMRRYPKISICSNSAALIVAMRPEDAPGVTMLSHTESSIVLEGSTAVTSDAIFETQ